MSCEHWLRRDTRAEWDGTVKVIADSHTGRRLNCPNDVIVARNGGIWFSDPHYRIMNDFEGFRADPELTCHVCRVEPVGRVEAVITDMHCPNGLCFSPDESLLYVADTGRMFGADVRAGCSGRTHGISGSATWWTDDPRADRGYTPLLRDARTASGWTATATFGRQPGTGCIA